MYWVSCDPDVSRTSFQDHGWGSNLFFVLVSMELQSRGYGHNALSRPLLVADHTVSISFAATDSAVVNTLELGSVRVL